MSTFVSISGGVRLFQIDTEQEPVIVTPSSPSPAASQAVITGSLSVGSADCGCLALFQIFYEYGGAIITEASSRNVNSPNFQPIITEDSLYYIVPENSNMADPKKISELTAASVNDIIANAGNAEILLSYDDAGTLTSYKLTFANLIDVIKAFVLTGKFEVTISGVGGQTNTLINRTIIDAELNEQNIAVLPAVPVSGEQGVYVNTATGDYELYNMGDDLTGFKLKIIYSNT